MNYDGPTIRCRFCGTKFRCEDPSRRTRGTWTSCAEPACGRVFHHAYPKDAVILRVGTGRWVTGKHERESHEERERGRGHAQ